MSIFSSEAYTKRHGDAQTQAQSTKGCVWKDNGKLYELMKCQKKNQIRVLRRERGSEKKKKSAWWRRGRESKAATRTREAQHDDIAGLSYQITAIFAWWARREKPTPVNAMAIYEYLLAAAVCTAHPWPLGGNGTSGQRTRFGALATWVSLDIRGPQAWVVIFPY